MEYSYDAKDVTSEAENEPVPYEPASVADYFVSEFGGPAEGGEDHSSSDIPAPTAERSDEAFGNVVFTNIELETSDDLTSAVAEVANVSEPEHCPFCRAGYDAQAIVCQRCKAVLTMSDLEMLISNLGADKLLLRDAVERLEAERSSRELSEAELTTLGIGHLNLQNLQYGFNYLLLASELNPNNVVLSGHVNALRIRLEEIKRRDEVHETMTKGKTILVVDDSPTVRKLIAGKLEKSGHDVICATDGVEAIERLREVVPDLVLLDITMPRMDGYQVCKMIRSNSTTQNVPVVMISGKDGFFDKVRGRMAGTTGYITKPFGPDTLMKAVETFLAGGVLSEQVN
jgi:twitching motility two-component system response regulator PilG